MAERHIEVIRENLPEVFEARVIREEWDDNYIFIDISSPDCPYMDDRHESSIDHNNSEFDEAHLIDNYIFDPDIDVPKDFRPTLEPLVGALGGDYPGSPVWHGSKSPVPPVDALAFYLPFHYYYPTWWGVYLLLDGVWFLAKYIWDQSGGRSGPLLPRDCWVAARLYLFYHEIYHHNAETFATRLEVTHRFPMYKSGFQRYYKSKLGTVDCIEESLAEANAFRKVLSTKNFPVLEKREALKEVFLEFIRRSPPGYAEAEYYLANKSFIDGRNKFAEDNWQFCFPKLPGKSDGVWDAAKYMFRGFTDRGKGRSKYIISRHSPLVKRIPIRPRIRPSKLKNKLQAFGCRFVRHGANHDVWQAANGHKFPIPRHPGELKDGLIRGILKQAGISASLDEFIS